MSRRQNRPRQGDVKDRAMRRWNEERNDRPRISIHERVTFPNARPQNGNQQRRPRSAAAKHELIWQVTVRSGGRASVEFVAAELARTTDRFLPVNMKLDRHGNVTFYVLSQSSADAVTFMNKRIAFPAGQQTMAISSKREPAPWKTLPTNIKKAISDAVTSRFNATSNVLDLNDFERDKGWTKAVYLTCNNLAFASLEFRVSLTRNAVMVEVVKTVAENFAETTGLSLRNNGLSSLDVVQGLVFAAPGVVEIDMSDNKIEDVTVLGTLSRWAIQRAHMENNPLCANYDSGSSYFADVSAQLTDLLYLDGVSHAPAPTSTTEESASPCTTDSTIEDAQDTPATADYDRNDLAVRRLMVEEFSQRSGMNHAWSQKCLEELMWDFEEAGRRFMELRAVIPSKAFLQ